MENRLKIPGRAHAISPRAALQRLCLALPRRLAALCGASVARGIAVLALLTAPTLSSAQQCANPGNDGPGGTLTGVINTYYPGTASASAGATSISVGTASGAGTAIAAGDLLLVVQMQDAAINSTNAGAYGDGAAGDPATGSTALNNSGRYEFVRATSAISGGAVSIVGEGAGSGLVYAYTNAAAGGAQGQRRFQVIRVPQYSSATVGAGLVAPYWNGSVGGVLVFDVAGQLDFNGQTIDLTGRGFRGGGGRALAGAAGGANTDYRTLASSALNGSKAEGVAGTPRYVLDQSSVTLVDTGVEGYPNGSYARGAPGNAGGGGTDGNPAANDQNSGGGGGGNGGAGGLGGNTWSSNLARGGFGGAAFAAAPDRLALGGGGGAGARNNSSGVLSSGGAGGGVVFIRAGSTTGSGTISTNGVSGQVPANDGGGGGGAGGTVVIYSASGGLGSLTVNARGAAGSNCDIGGSPHGPGGGGGGGYVALSSAAASISVTAGAAGYTVSAGNNYGAAGGSAGTSTTALTSVQITGVNPSSECVPQLTVVKTTSTATIVNGPASTTATYTITVTNAAGLSTASTIAILDTLPAGFTFASASAPVLAGGASRPSTTNPAVGDAIPTWGTFTIPSGGSVAITYVVNVAASVAAGTYQNPATARYLDPKRTTAAGTTTSTYVASSSNGENVTVTIPDLSLDKRHVAAFTVGGTGVYTIVVRNLGTAATVGAITVRDTLPAGLTYNTAAGVGWTIPVPGTQEVVATFAGAIAAGDSAKFTITANVLAGAFPSVTNAAAATGGGDNSAPNNRDVDPTAITGVPDLTIDKRHTTAFTVGQSATYTIVVRNLGTAVTANAITVRDTLPAGLTYNAAAGAGWTIPVPGAQEVVASFPGVIAAGDSAKFTITVNVLAGAFPSVTNAAAVSMAGDLSAANNRDVDPTAITGVPDVTIDKRHVAAFTVGQSATYTIVVRNIGTAATIGATTVRDTVPASLTGAAGAGGGWSFGGVAPEIVATFAASIAAGDSAKFTITATVTAAAFPNVTNAASVSSASDLDPANNRDTDPATVIGIADLAMDKRHTVAFLDGQSGVYTFVVRNLGTAASSGTITVRDTLPAGLTYQSFTPGTGWAVVNVAQIVTATINSAVAAGDSAKFTVTVLASTAAVPSVTNAATLSNASDTNPANNRDVDPTTVNGTTDVALDKRHTGVFEVSSTDTYTIVVFNVGTGAIATGIAVADTLPAGLSYVSASGAGWTVPAPVGQVVNASFAGVLAAGDSAKFTITVAIAAPAFPQVTNAATAIAAGDVNAANNRDVDVTRVHALPDLTLLKRHVAPFVDGQNAAWTIVTTNISSGPTISTATVRDTLPAGITYVSGAGTGWSVAETSPGSGIVQADFAGAIAGHDSASFTITVHVGAAAVPTVTNRAWVSGAGDIDLSNNAASDPAAVQGVPDLALSKRHTAAFTVGQNGVYTVVVRNVGTASIAGPISVRDTLPVGLTLQGESGSGWTFTAAGQALTASHLTGIATADSAMFAITCSVAASAFPTVTNTATLSAAGDPNPANDVASDPTAITGVPDLSIDKRHTSAFTVGQPGVYTIVVRNLGTAVSGAVTVTDTLLAGLGLSSGAGAGWTVTGPGPAISATHAAIAAGDSASFTLNVAVGAPAVPQVMNSATVASPGDVSAANDRDSDPTAVSGVPDLVLDKRHTAAFVVGQDAAYEFVVRNAGSAASGVVTVRDTLPAGLAPVGGSGAGWSIGNNLQIVTATLAGGLANGDSAKFTYTVHVLAAAVPAVTNRATASSTNGELTPADNVDADPTAIGGVPDVAVVKRHTSAFVVGQQAAYRIVVTNLGTAPTSGATTVTDVLPAGLSYVSANGAGWNVTQVSPVTMQFPGSIAAGDSAVFTLTVGVTAAAFPAVTNSATASTANDLDPSNDTGSDPTAIGGVPDLRVQKRHSTAFMVGQVEVYDIVVSNIGTAATSATTTVRDTLPAGLSLQSPGVSGAGWSPADINGQIVSTDHSGSIAASDSAKFTLTVLVGASAFPNVTNSATSKTPGDADSTNDRGLDPTVIAGSPDLAIDKRHTTPFTVGQQGVYTIVVRNLGTGDAVGAISVSDSLPAGLSNPVGSGGNWDVGVAGQRVTADYLGTIAAGDSASFTLTVQVGPAAFPSITNSASVSIAGGDVDPTNDRDSDPTAVGGAADVTIEKRHVTPFAVGQTGIYTIVVHNVGSAATASPIGVTDPLPPGLKYLSAEPGGWLVGASPDSQTVTASYAGVVATGDSASFSFTVAAAAAASPSVTNTATVSMPGDLDPTNDSASDPTLVAGVPDLAIDKRHTTTFTVGQDATYEIVVTNVGTAATIDTVNVTDTLPAGLTLVSLTGAGWSSPVVTGADVSTAYDAILAVNDSAKFTLVVHVGSAAFPSVINSARATTPGQIDFANDVDTDPAAVTGAPDVALDKRHTTPFSVGTPGSYQLVVTNVGSAATGPVTTVVDTLPAGLKFEVAAGAGWAFSAPDSQIVTATFAASIAPGDSARFTLGVTVAAAALPAVTNSALATTAGDVDPANDRDTDPTPISGYPDLAIDKRHTSNFRVGDRDTFVVVVANVGTVSADLATAVLDTLPTGLTLAPGGLAGAGWTFVRSGSQITATHGGAIAAGDSAEFVIVVQVAPAALPGVTNSATVTNTEDLNPTNNRDSDPVVVVGAPDVTLDKRHGAVFAPSGSGVYEFVVTNVGLGPTTAATAVVDTLPAALRFASLAGAGWTVSTPDSQIVTATYAAPIAAGDSARFSLTVTIAASPPISVTNSATASTPGDVNVNNDRDSDPTALALTPDLAIDKRHTSNFRVGELDTFVVVVRNVGPVAADSAVVVDVLPAGITVAAGTGGTGWAFNVAGQNLKATYPGVIAAGDSAAFVLRVLVAQSAYPLVINTATVTNSHDLAAANNVDSDTVAVIPMPELSIAKSHTVPSFAVGKNGLYQLRASNLGTANTVGATTIVDTLPPGLEYVSSSGAGWVVTPNAADSTIVTAVRASTITPGAGASVFITVSVGLAAFPSVTNAATISGGADVLANNNRATDPTVVTASNLTLDKRHTSPFVVGQPGTYTIVVSNIGPAASDTVVVTDALPPGLSFVSGAGAGWTVTSVDNVDVVAKSAGLIAAGDSASFDVIVAVGGAARPSVVNSATASTSNDHDLSNNSDADPTAVSAALDLAVDLRNAGGFNVGQNGTYQVAVTNVGTDPTTGATTVTDTLPAGLTYVPATPGNGWVLLSQSGANGEILTFQFAGVIAAGDSATFAFTVAVGAPALPSVTNSAVVSTPGDGNAANDRDVDTIAISGVPDLTIDKRHTVAFAAGQPATYTIVVRNVGNGPTAGTITVGDALPAGLTYFSGAGAGWNVSAAAQQVTATFSGILAAGDSAKFTVTVNVLGNAVPSVTNTATVAGGGDVTPGNDTDTDVAAVAGGPDLTIDKRHTTPFVVGLASDYTIVVRNVGSAPTVGAITVKDTLPVGLVFNPSGGPGWSGVVALGRVVTATYPGVLAPGDSAQFALTTFAQPAAAPGVINSAEVSGGGDVNGANNRDTDPTAVAGIPELTLDKRHTAAFVVGQPGTYTIVVRNLGTGDTGGAVTVDDALPAGLTYSTGAGAGWNVSAAGQQVTATFNGTIAAGDSAKFTVTVDVLVAAVPTVTNTATVAGGGDVTPANNSDSDVTAVTGTPDLTLDKRHITLFRLDNAGTYLLVVRNIAAAPSSGAITVTDTLPAGLTYVLGSGEGWGFSAAGQIVTATYSLPIAAGDSAVFSLVVNIGPAALPAVTNSATVAGGGDASPANNRDSDAVRITGTALLAATKTVSPTEVEVGGVVDYAIGVSNLGDGPVDQAEITDVLPTGLRFVAGSARIDGKAVADPGGAPGRVLHFQLGTLRGGSHLDLTYRVQVAAGSEIGSGINTATVNGFDPTENKPTSSNTAAVALVIRPGVFGDEGIIAGKVIVDCDCAGDRLQGNEDLGIPGVRLYLEDGTSAVTDEEGKYSFNHVRPRLHVVRIDDSTLPLGARMAPIANRNAGSGMSQFVDLKRGELHRADFVEGSRSEGVLAAVKARRLPGEVTEPMFGDDDAVRGEAGTRSGDGVSLGAAVAAGGSGHASAQRLLALGLLNARLDWHGLSKAQLDGAPHDRFEDELRDVGHRSDDGKFEAGARAALFLSGTVGDNVDVALRYDSERQPERRLFSDIRPDEGYQTLGDASVHGFDTQSAGRLFARVSRGESFAMYGDLSTPSDPARQLGAFSRRLNGGLASLALGRVRVGGFASQGHQHQVIDEFQAQGISGPYTLSRPDGTLGSEQVELLVRDRNQPARVVSRMPQLRFTDYTLEPFTGRLVFRHPIASIDEHLNPVYIRVTYESESAGDAFWVYGADARVSPFHGLTLGGSASKDEDPLAPRALTSGDATLRLGSALTIVAEAAHSDSGGTFGSSAKSGKATRIEALLSAGNRLGLKLRTQRSDIDFDNPSSGIPGGREEQGFDLNGVLGTHGKLFATGIRTRDLATDGVRKGVQVGLGRTFPHNITIEGQWRWSKEGAIPASPNSLELPISSNTLGGKLTTPVPWVHRATMFGEAEQDVTWQNRHRLAFGSDIQVTSKTRLFARHENMASLNGPFAINDYQQEEFTVVGLTSDELPNGHVYSEYRLRDATAGREGQAAIGLRNRWALRDGLYYDAGFERVVVIRDGSGAGTAATSALEYTGSPLWKGTVRGEWRRQDGNDQWLSGATMERKLSRDWAALGRTDWFRQMAERRTDGRSQFGLAYRGTETNRLSALARYDNRIEMMGGLASFQRVSHVLSSHANWQPGQRLTLSGQLAGKWATDGHDGLFTRTSVKLVAGRALVDLTKRLDVGATGRTEFGGGYRYGAGGELGWMAATNMRLAAGYNVFGYNAADMLNDQRTDKGPYIDFGWKFDPFWGDASAPRARAVPPVSGDSR